MRVATTSHYAQAVKNLQDQASQIGTLQTQISSELRVNKPSDDPVAAAQAERIRARQAKLEADQRMIDHAKGMLQQADSAVGSASDELQHARELLLTASAPAFTDADRASLAEELSGTLGNLIAIANQSDGNGGYVFGGAGTDRSPFTTSGSIVYQTQTGQQSVATDPALATTQDGEDAFIAIPQADGGTRSVFDAISAAIDALQDTALSDTDRMAAIDSTIDSVDASFDRLSFIRTRIGESLKIVDSQTSLAESTSITLQSRLSDLVDLDYTKALTEMTSSQVAYQAAMQTYAAVSRMSLFQYL
ncbi:MAG: flagellar hook-associated protein FlgL [Burkholderiaceae bacterium]